MKRDGDSDGVGDGVGDGDGVGYCVGVGQCVSQCVGDGGSEPPQRKLSSISGGNKISLIGYCAYVYVLRDG